MEPTDISEAKSKLPSLRTCKVWNMSKALIDQNKQKWFVFKNALKIAVY